VRGRLDEVGFEPVDLGDCSWGVFAAVSRAQKEAATAAAESIWVILCDLFPTVRKLLLLSETSCLVEAVWTLVLLQVLPDEKRTFDCSAMTDWL